MYRRHARLAQPALARFRWFHAASRLRLIDLRGVSDLDGGGEAFVIRIVDSDSHVYAVAVLEMQHVVGPCVRREPVVPFDIFAVVLKMGKSLVFLFLQQSG